MHLMIGVPETRSCLLLNMKGERVDLLAFPPVCLPSSGQGFGGETEGKVSGGFLNRRLGEAPVRKMV